MFKIFKTKFPPSISFLLSERFKSNRSHSAGVLVMDIFSICISDKVEVSLHTCERCFICRWKVDVSLKQPKGAAALVPARSLPLLLLPLTVLYLIWFFTSGHFQQFSFFLRFFHCSYAYLIMIYLVDFIIILLHRVQWTCRVCCLLLKFGEIAIVS